jgi:RNA recognition motif-containing protein
VPPQKVEKLGGDKLTSTAQEEEDGADESFTLFVKNLNFATTEEGLRAAFEKRTRGVRAVSIPRKPARKDGGKQVSFCLALGIRGVRY